MNLEFDLIIVGGGMVGLTLANALQTSGMRIAMVEASAREYQLTEHFELRVSALNRSSEHLLLNLGAGACLNSARAGHFDAMQVWEHQGTGRISFDAAHLAEPHLGSIVENRAIQAALAAQLQDNVSWFCPARAESLELGPSQVVLRLACGQTLQAHLIVGADGANSWVRKQTPIESVGWAYDQSAIVCSVRSEYEHRNIARQVFMPTGPLAFLPLGEPHSCSIVWSHTPEQAQQLSAAQSGQLSGVLTEIVGSQLGQIECVSAAASFPLHLRHSKQYVLPGLALIGDAAHSIHPLAGQGLNLGLKDAAALAEVLLATRDRGRPLGALHSLRAYERWRKGDNLATMAAMEGFKRLFGAHPPPIKAMRNIGLSLTDRLLPLKQFFMQHAEGSMAELPRLMRAS